MMIGLLLDQYSFIMQHIPKVIEFYRAQGQFGFLSNFYQSPFHKDNKKYMTVEHFYQSKKFQGKQMEEIIREADSPAEAFRLGRTANTSLRQDWEQIKQKVMEEGLFLKFEQNANLVKLLIQTGNSKLVEHTKNDKYWADGGNGSGKNRLGILLMNLREKYLHIDQQKK